MLLPVVGEGRSEGEELRVTLGGLPLLPLLPLLLPLLPLPVAWVAVRVEGHARPRLGRPQRKLLAPRHLVRVRVRVRVRPYRQPWPSPSPYPLLTCTKTVCVGS